MKKHLPKKISIRKSALKSSDSEWVKTVQQGMETPIADIFWCSVVRPTYFSGSAIPRYKVQLELDPKKETHKKYLDDLEALAREWKVESLGKMTEKGTILMTYQGKEPPITKMVEFGKKRPITIDLEHDMPKGFKCKIKFDLKRYIQKQDQKNAFTFTPREVIFYLDEETQSMIEVEDGDCQDSGD